MGVHDYFDYLAAHAKIEHANSFRSQTLIDNDTNANPPNSSVTYDASMDAAKVTTATNAANLPLEDTLVPAVNFSTGQTDDDYMTYWEARWPDTYQPNRGGLNTHKCFRHDVESGAGERRIFEVRSRYSQTSPPGVCKVDLRVYDFRLNGETEPDPTNEFVVAQNVWTSYWFYVNFNSLKVSMWMADVTRDPPIKLFDALTLSGSGKVETDFLTFSFNSSQSRTGPPLESWVRNFASLRDIGSVAAAQTIVDAWGGVVLGNRLFRRRHQFA